MKRLIILVCAISFAFAQSEILVNVVGYEKTGAKRAVIQSSGTIADTGCEVLNSQGTSVHSVSLETQTTVPGWSGRNFKVADFSEFSQDGKYRLKCGSVESAEFSIGEKILQKGTGDFQVSFFNGMRNTYEGDKALPIYGTTQTHNIYGGWWDATGDPGKHLSHLSYANYFNPQQIPLVVWALLQANEFQPGVYGNDAKDEAAWGADYLLRSLSTQDYFYMSVFDTWGAGHREICAWSHSDGIRSSDYKSAMREGGGVSIAALARASKAGISKDSSSAQYLAGAKRAYAHLKANPTAYQDDKKENIIDDYCGLLAATELYNATNDTDYRTDAEQRVQSLLSRQSEEGWFYTTKNSSGNNMRPFYHAADEGLPVVALARYAEVFEPSSEIRQAIRKNLEWYVKITYEKSNPFEYAKMYGDVGEVTIPGATDLARGKTATASRSEASYTPNLAFDGSSTTRWSSYQNGADNDNQWIAVDLGSVYNVDQVVLNWETSFGKSYHIDVSLDEITWTSVLGEITNTSSGKRTHSFTPVSARYVKMRGIERGYEYGGFSLYNFEVYGEQEPDVVPPTSPSRFFMPHENETGYWWQGENARIASLSAAFIMGAQLGDPSGKLWLDNLFAMAIAQLDWILGKNPFGVSMMFGFGSKNYPNYPAGGLNNIKGGICNGITAKDGNESDLEWKPYGDGDWQNWRYIEQWLPHNAWYLTALAALSHRIDNPVVYDPNPIRDNYMANVSNFKISVMNGKNVKVQLPFAADQRTVIDIYSMKGQKLLSYSVPAGSLEANIKMPSGISHGIYLLSIRGHIAGKIYLQ